MQFLCLIVLLIGYVQAYYFNNGFLSMRETREESNTGNYNFEYNEDHDQASSFRRETRQGNKVTGEYGMKLPDGRMRIVKYIADENGYRTIMDSNEHAMVVNTKGNTNWNNNNNKPWKTKVINTNRFKSDNSEVSRSQRKSSGYNENLNLIKRQQLEQEKLFLQQKLREQEERNKQNIQLRQQIIDQQSQAKERNAINYRNIEREQEDKSVYSDLHRQHIHKYIAPLPNMKTLSNNLSTDKQQQAYKVKHEQDKLIQRWIQDQKEQLQKQEAIKKMALEAQHQLVLQEQIRQQQLILQQQLWNRKQLRKNQQTEDNLSKIKKQPQINNQQRYILQQQWILDQQRQKQREQFKRQKHEEHLLEQHLKHQQLLQQQQKEHEQELLEEQKQLKEKEKLKQENQEKGEEQQIYFETKSIIEEDLKKKSNLNNLKIQPEFVVKSQNIELKAPRSSPENLSNNESRFKEDIETNLFGKRNRMNSRIRILEKTNTGKTNVDSPSKKSWNHSVKQEEEKNELPVQNSKTVTSLIEIESIPPTAITNKNFETTTVATITTEPSTTTTATTNSTILPILITTKSNTLNETTTTSLPTTLLENVSTITS